MCVCMYIYIYKYIYIYVCVCVYTHTCARASAKLLQLHPTLCDPMDYSPSCSSVHRILQARILEWVAMPSSRGSPQPRDRTHVPCTGGRLFTAEPPGKGNIYTYIQIHTHTHTYVYIYGKVNGNPLQYSSLGIPTDRGAWWVTVHGVAKESDMT